MLKFTLQNDQICVDFNIQTLKEFSDILDYGKKKNKPDLANRMLLYVFYCCDLTEDNPMRDIDFRMKPEQAMSRAFRNKKDKFTKEEQPLIDAAIDAYNFFNEDSAERAVLAIDQKIDEARTTLEEHEVEIVRNINQNTGEVKFASNASILEKLATSIGDLMTLKIKVVNAAKKIENAGRVRGGKGSSMIERGNLIRKQSE